MSELQPSPYAMKPRLAVPKRWAGWIYTYLKWSGASVSPHSATLRATYQPASGYVAHTVMASINTIRKTAATTAGVVAVYITLNSTNYADRIIEVLHYVNTAGSNTFINIPVEIYLTSDDILRAYTYDPSTGGTMDYTITLLIVEGLL